MGVTGHLPHLTSPCTSPSPPKHLTIFIQCDLLNLFSGLWVTARSKASELSKPLSLDGVSCSLHYGSKRPFFGCNSPKTGTQWLCSGFGEQCGTEAPGSRPKQAVSHLCMACHVLTVLLGRCHLAAPNSMCVGVQRERFEVCRAGLGTRFETALLMARPWKGKALIAGSVVELHSCRPPSPSPRALQLEEDKCCG
uniref:Uncharacterized protein n=1 Tax=Anas platyrhynchos platyrhynchos TaxID=8840 RepID=A0A493TVH2_ANAPP